MPLRIALVAAALVAAIALPASAEAARGFATANVNMRAGPGTNYPAVAVVPAGSAVTVHGCIRGYRWCDITWRSARGWISGSYVEIPYQRRRVLLPSYGAAIGLPIIGFSLGSYWDSYYRDRPWFAERRRWIGRPYGRRPDLRPPYVRPPHFRPPYARPPHVRPPRFRQPQGRPPYARPPFARPMQPGQPPRMRSPRFERGPSVGRPPRAGRPPFMGRRPEFQRPRIGGPQRFQGGPQRFQGGPGFRRMGPPPGVNRPPIRPPRAGGPPGPGRPGGPGGPGPN